VLSVSQYRLFRHF